MPKGFALHIGVNRINPAHYDGWSGPLVACESDAKAMKLIAESQGFQSRMLLTAEATRAAVLDGLRAAEALTTGDIFLLTYSGHGGQLPDLDGEEADRQDETWCLYDGQLVDDELYVAFGRLAAGVRVFVLSDSCHSGTVIKMTMMRAEAVSVSSGTAVARRAMPPEIALRTYQANKDFYDAIAATLPADRRLEQGRDVRASVRLISGCQDNQFSMDGTFNGAFTGELIVTWAGGRFRGNYADFHLAIQKALPDTQSPNHFTIGPKDPDFDLQVPFTI